MIEVEIKARLRDFDEVRENMSKLGIWLENKETQTDAMFGQEKFLNSEHKLREGTIMARIRQKAQKVIVCFKEVNRGHAEFESEFEAPDFETAKRFLEKLEFKEAFTIKKLREHYGYARKSGDFLHAENKNVFEHKNFKICLDDVEELGKFIEIEKIVSKQEEKEKSINECKDLLNFLSPNAKIETQKYGDLMQDLINKKNLAHES